MQVARKSDEREERRGISEWYSRCRQSQGRRRRQGQTRCKMTAMPLAQAILSTQRTAGPW